MSSRLFGTLAFFFLLVLLLALSKHTSVSGFRGGEGIGGRTAGPAASMLSPADIEGFEEQREKEKADAIKGREPASTLEGFADLPVQGKDEVNSDSTLSPGPAALNTPRKPYHLLSDVLQDAPRGTVGCLRAGCCDETDFESRTNLTGNYIQRTNNYKRVYPDNCSGPLHEFTMSFYKTEKL